MNNTYLNIAFPCCQNIFECCCPELLLQKKSISITFGYNTINKENYGIMMYYKNRLIRAYEHVGCQRKVRNFWMYVCEFNQRLSIKLYIVSVVLRIPFVCELVFGWCFHKGWREGCGSYWHHRVQLPQTSTQQAGLLWHRAVQVNKLGLDHILNVLSTVTSSSLG